MRIQPFGRETAPKKSVMLAPTNRADTLAPLFQEITHEIVHNMRYRRDRPAHDGKAIGASLRSIQRLKRKSKPRFRRRKSGKNWVDFEEAVASLETRRLNFYREGYSNRNLKLEPPHFDGSCLPARAVCTHCAHSPATLSITPCGTLLRYWPSHTTAFTRIGRRRRARSGGLRERL